MSTHTTEPTPQQVLNFWFGDLSEQGDWDKAIQKSWFMGGAAMDTRIREGFEHTYQRAINGELDHWVNDHHGRLALVVILDQFSRNLHRGSAQAFAQDPKALQITLDTINARLDSTYLPIERTFLYMPLEHSERMSDQLLSVQVMTRNAKDVPSSQSKLLNGFIEYAHNHMVLIEQFGRFPHRNDVLGRTSTEEEVAFLSGGGARFGQ